jgi:hypothetical protein
MELHRMTLVTPGHETTDARIDKNHSLYVACVLFAVAILGIILGFTFTSLATTLTYLSLVLVTLLVYYKYLTQIRFTFSLAFPVFIILMIQIIVYPFYIFVTGNSRAYLFGNIVPEYTLAIFLWFLAIVGFGLGICIKTRITMNTSDSDPQILLFSDEHQILTGQNIIMITLPLILLSLLAAYVQFRSYGYTSLEEIANLGSFSADSIRRNRGLGPLSMLEMWSYVAVAYVGWHAFSQRRFRNSKLLLGIVYVLMGSALSFLNARRSVLLIHLGLLFLPFALNFIARKRWVLFLIPIALVTMFFLDLVTSELRQHYYRTNQVDLVAAVSTMRDERYVPMSFNHLEYSAALLELVQAEQFRPMMGSTLVAAALNWIPRRLFPDKPWTGGPYLAIALGGTYSFDDTLASSSITTGVIVEMLMNFGLFAFVLTPLLMVFVGYFLSGISLDYFRSKISLISLTAFSIYFWNITSLFADDMGGLVTKFLMNTFGLAFLYFLTRLVTRRATMPVDSIRFPYKAKTPNVALFSSRK